MMEAIANDIEWIPSAKNDLIKLQEKTGKDLSKGIQIFSSYEQKMLALTASVSRLDSLMVRQADFDYLNIWIAELYYLKATIAILGCPQLQVKCPVKGRFDKVRLMDLEEMGKRRREIEILEREARVYKGEEIKKLGEILRMLSDAAYASYSTDCFSKLQNTLKLLCNLLTRHSITPFYHLGEPIWQHFCFLALMAILGLRKIREGGYDVFKRRYSRKHSRT
jgi:hypothetical protein